MGEVVNIFSCTILIEYNRSIADKLMNNAVKTVKIHSTPDLTMFPLSCLFNLTKAQTYQGTETPN